jgi:hypothetical protein
MQVKKIMMEDGIRLIKQLVKQLGALDEAKHSLRDASEELGIEERTSIAHELLLAANLCRLASDILVPQIKWLEQDVKRAAQARSKIQIATSIPAQEPENPYEPRGIIFLQDEKLSKTSTKRA